MCQQTLPYQVDLGADFGLGQLGLLAFPYAGLRHLHGELVLLLHIGPDADLLARLLNSREIDPLAATERKNSC